jgi:hypothetical protein
VSQGSPSTPPRKKLAGYRVLQVSWHESIPEDFSPADVLIGLAESRDLVVSDRAGKVVRRLRIDTEESARQRDRKSSAVDKTVRRDAAKLLRRAFKDPRTADRIKRLVERARQGEDVAKELADVMNADA